MEKMNVYEMVTARIVEEMSKGNIPWQKPWKGAKGCAADYAISYTSRRAYSILNQWLLGEPGEYLTFNQIQALGGKLKRGSKSRMVVFYTKAKYIKKDEETGEEKEVTYPLLKYYNVFHINQTEGIPSKVKADEEVAIETDLTADAVIADYVQREGIKFYNKMQSDRAYYQPSADMVVVSMPEQYTEIAEYYSTTFHELTHSTMKKSRCDREMENADAFFGNHSYSREELVAEMGAAMICSRLGLAIDKSLRNSAAYIQGWIKTFKGDPKMIVWASSRAEKAARYILNEKGDEAE